LRNTMRFLLGSVHEFDPAKTVPVEEMPELERYMLHLVAELDETVRKAYAAYDFPAVWQAVFTFATVDLSAFYFDVRKDALYCDAPGAARRQACLTVLDALFHRLVTWLAPILVFTMEEVWLERYPGEDSSVHLQDMPPAPSEWHNAELARKAARIRRIRRVVTGALEVARRDKVIGASLEAAPVVHVPTSEMALLNTEQFADLCITSAITVTDAPAPADAFRLEDEAEIAVVFALAEGKKCRRCWKILPDVGQFANADVCGRCNEALIALR
ncbi:MAG: class I tRNA ligase family protein, partial [Pseudomonadota bacterium]